MTTEQQRIAIAEFCGWTEIRIIGVNPYGVKPGEKSEIVPATCTKKSPPSKIPSFVPDYPLDLNAMHEAEKRLISNDTLWGDYCDLLYDVGAYHSSAAQRSEAFCRTLWPESFIQPTFFPRNR